MRLGGEMRLDWATNQNLAVGKGDTLQEFVASFGGKP